MKVALQTICWGDRLKAKHWPDLLPAIKAAGYDGVEIFQAPSELPPYAELRQLCQRFGIRILGLSGGTIDERKIYIRPSRQPYPPGDEAEPYIYIEGWEKGCDEADLEGFRLALHYHHLSILPTVEDGLALLEKHPTLGWLPDTAHLYIGRQDQAALRVLLTKPDWVKKTVAIHVKDWKPIFGRLSHRYARGFCKPGEGEVGLETLMTLLNRNPLTKGLWAVVELDHTSVHPEADVFESAQTLYRWKVMERRPEQRARAIEPEDRPIPSKFPLERLLQLAHIGGDKFFPDLAELLLQTTGAEECFICSVLTAERQVTARIRRPVPTGTPEEIERERTAAKALARRVIDAKREVRGDDGMLSVPLFNCFNPHSVRHVLVYRIKRGVLGDICTNPELTKAVAMAIDIVMAQGCQNISQQASHLASKHPNRAEMLREIAKMLKTELRCQGVTIFLAKAMLEVLEVGGTTGIRWDPALVEQNQQNYHFGVGLTGEVARARSYRIYRYRGEEGRKGLAAAQRSRSDETGPDNGPLVGEDVCSVLSACFFNESDQVAGVVRCRNPIGEDGHTVMFFSEDDLALVESAMLAVQPELESYAQDLRAMIGYEVLLHELTNPVLFVRNAAFRAHRAITAYQSESGRVILRHNYLEQIDGWLDMVSFQLEAFKYFVQGKLRQMVPEKEPTLFFAEIVAPMVAQFRLPLEERGFPEKGIDYGDEEMWKKTPRLFIDRKLFTQVVANLLNNAIKYAYRDPKVFRVRIWGEGSDGFAVIHFEDEGIGIAPEWREVIFTRGGRIVTRDREQIHGYGLGLWLARQIVELHGGTLTLTRCLPDSTRFTIRLPLAARLRRIEN